MILGERSALLAGFRTQVSRCDGDPRYTRESPKRRRRLSRLKLDDYLPYRLSVASNAVSRRVARAYETRFGLKTPEWRLVAVLAEDGELTLLELMSRTAMDKVTVSRAAQGLAERGLAAKTHDERDRRSRRLALTAEGQRLHAEVAPAALAVERELLADLTPQEVETLEALLVRVETAARKLQGSGSS
ncbi:MAG TPA: MarR family winged helix-turn-helix transcriptional regulator [Caulobacteraceae bacterium]|jgi:DNA-binding MarR family transcriptional regulator